MKYSHFKFDDAYTLSENAYFMPSGPDAATLFALSNGYIGVRASLEEYGSVGIQGAYIRGVIDACPCAPVPVIENEFLKKWYFFEENIRRFQSNDTIINFADFLLLRFSVNGETFYPWDGTVLEWKRCLDMKNGRLTRHVRWENTKGEITVFEFERFASYDNDRVFALKVTVTPENYSGIIKVTSGIDYLTKSSGGTGGGWLVTTDPEYSIEGNRIYYSCNSGKKFRFRIALGTQTDIFTGGKIAEADYESYTEEDGIIAICSDIAVNCGESFTVEKKVYVVSSRESDDPQNEARKVEKLSDYASLYTAHTAAYNEAFGRINVIIDGDDEADRALRFSNYHTLATFNRNDAVHSLAPKGLSGPGYSGLVWWDCEVYQSPIFYATMPEAAKNLLIYRYRCLDGARTNAVNEGYKGARYPFNSAIDGTECCWPVPRHPYMQIHIVSDVAWSINNYYNCTADDDFMLEYGMEMLYEICRYWLSRVEKDERGYIINQVAGTDEHHAYIDNNAYTNYCVKYLTDRTVELDKKYGTKVKALKDKIGFNESELKAVAELAENIYLPMSEESGLIPQFDGYLELSRDLEHTAKVGENMKEFQINNGLYHKSQVIKQPDVLMLFAYQSFKFDSAVYRHNWDYYRARCESSSSLSYSVHSICAADNDEPESAYSYFMQTALMDLDDEHNCTDAGIHAACAAGAWSAAVRGIGGTVLRSEFADIQPHMIPWWKSLEFGLVWHGQRFKVKISNNSVVVTADSANSGILSVRLCGTVYELTAGQSASAALGLAGRTKCEF